MSEATQTEKKQAQKERKAYRAKKRKLFFKTLFSRKIVLVSAIVVLLIILIAIFADFLMPYNPNQISIPERNQGMSAAHWLGTDEYGRDLLSRVIAGSRVSLIVGLLAVIIACVIGTTLGMIAGYFGGILNLAIVLGISNTTVYIRMMRSQVLSIKERDYIMAGKLQGNSNFRLMFHHILPNSISPIIVTMTQQVGNTILSEAGLSFLGLGISKPTATWGALVNGGRSFLLTNPIYSLAPGIAIALLVICLNTLGDGVRDALDPRLRGEV